MSREERVNKKVERILGYMSKIHALEIEILKCFKFKDFDNQGMPEPFIQEHEDGQIVMVDDDGNELELDEACEIMEEFGCISPIDFHPALR